MNDGPEFCRRGAGDVLRKRWKSTALLKTDLEAGLWDNADVRVFLVNWQTPSEHVLLRRARIGEVGRAGAVFRAELRGLAHLLESRQGRVFARICDADLGDSRCKVDLTNSAYQATATVTTAQREWLRVTGLETYANGWFSRGRVTVLTGPLSVFASEVANHRQEGAVSVLSLFQPAPELLAPGTEVVVRAGCSKDLETCRTKFANHLNYQGFPHMPGSDFALSYPNRNTGLNDGSAPCRVTLWGTAGRRCFLRRAAGSARPTAIRQAAGGRAAIAWGSCAASGAHFMGTTRRRCRPIRRTGRRPAGARNAA